MLSVIFFTSSLSLEGGLKSIFITSFFSTLNLFPEEVVISKNKWKRSSNSLLLKRLPKAPNDTPDKALVSNFDTGVLFSLYSTTFSSPYLANNALTFGGKSLRPDIIALP